MSKYKVGDVVYVINHQHGIIEKKYVIGLANIETVNTDGPYFFNTTNQWISLLADENDIYGKTYNDRVKKYKETGIVHGPIEKYTFIEPRPHEIFDSMEDIQPVYEKCLIQWEKDKLKYDKIESLEKELEILRNQD